MKLKDIGILPEKIKFKYFKTLHRGRYERVNRKSRLVFYTIIGEPDIEVSEEEYEQNIKEATKDKVDAFMGRATKQVYYSYYRKDDKEIQIKNDLIDNLAEKDLDDYVVGEVCSCWWEMEEYCPTCKGTGVVLKARKDTYEKTQAPHPDKG